MSLNSFVTVTRIYLVSTVILFSFSFFPGVIIAKLMNCDFITQTPLNIAFIALFIEYLLEFQEVITVTEELTLIYSYLDLWQIGPLTIILIWVFLKQTDRIGSEKVENVSTSQKNRLEINHLKTINFLARNPIRSDPN